jgi:hypothetical protein
MAMLSGWWTAALACNLLVSIGLVAKLCASPLQYALNPAQTSVGIAYFFVLLSWVEAELAVQLGGQRPFAKLDSIELSPALSTDEDNDDDASDAPLEPTPTCSTAVSASALVTLRACAELAAIMIVMYVCDRTSLVGRGPKHQSRTEFWVVFLLCCALSLLGLRKTHDAERAGDGASLKPLQREQTEEWKGWMQVMFLLYHYWMAAELYNAIRIHIAAYIWMTGFGNFSYYYTKRDFAFPRFAQMMWRLNFLVTFVCLTLNNEYMLYYICPLHTLFTIFVYSTLWLQNERNAREVSWIVGKMVAVLAISLVIWDVPGVFQALWWPLTPLLRYSGPDYRVVVPLMHEWRFRSVLDHLVWIAGMAVAFCFPRIDAWLNSLDAGGRELTRCAQAHARVRRCCDWSSQPATRVVLCRGRPLIGRLDFKTTTKRGTARPLGDARGGTPVAPTHAPFGVLAADPTIHARPTARFQNRCAARLAAPRERALTRAPTRLARGVPAARRSARRWSAIGLASAVFAGWVWAVGSLPKFEYNKLHPYTSFVPILCYIFLRNSTRWLRERVLPAWGEIGKYTLETYICQFHIWMRTTGLNGSPKFLLVLVPGSFWLNFVVVTALYLYLSVRLFKVTVALKDLVLPNDSAKIVTNLLNCALGAVGFAALGWGTHAFFSLPPNASA